jgi:hypothetical protein
MAPRGVTSYTPHSEHRDLPLRYRVGCMEDRSPICESIEVVTRFVKQYPDLHGTETCRDTMVPVVERTSLQDLTRVEGITQAITDVVGGNYGEKNHQAWKDCPVGCEVQMISGIR